jgi:hypothetical protein
MVNPAALSFVLSVVVFVASARLQPANNAATPANASKESALCTDTLFDIG